MFAEERQEKIYAILQKNGAVTTSELVSLFCVSLETIRRDLLAMEKQNRLLRVHGGAVVKREMKPHLELKERNKEYNTQKRELSLKATEFIKDGDMIAVDEGSTAIVFAEVLKEKFNRLTVVTHSLDVFNILCDGDAFDVILCGGHYMKDEKSFYGALTLDMIGNLRVQKAFLFPYAVSLNGGICDYHKDLFLIQRQMISISEEVYFMADSSKFEKTALLKIDDMKDGYFYITDSGLSDGLKNLYKENNKKVFY